MKKMLFPLFFVTSFASLAQTTYQITTRNNAYSPVLLSVLQKDVINIALGATHDFQEVSEATWLSNDETPLPGGYFIAKGGAGTLVFDTTGVFYYICTPHVKLHGMKGRIVIDLPTGISSALASKAGISLYPNPSQENVTVQVPIGMEVQFISLCNNLGKEVFRQHGFTSAGTYTLPVASLEKGVYLAIISTKGQRYSGKIVLQ